MLDQRLIGVDDGGEIRAPMASVIGGLLCWIVLSLVIVPAVFVEKVSHDAVKQTLRFQI